MRTVSYGYLSAGTSPPPIHLKDTTSGGNVMQHLDTKRPAPSVKVFDVIAYCRSQYIDEREIRKLLLVVGRFATRLEIQMNLTKRPVRFR